MKIYTLIAGINGTGKSSLAGVLSADRDDLGIIIDPDEIAKDNACGPIEAGKIAIHRMRDFLQQGISFTQETTLSGHRVLRTIQEAKNSDYSIRIFYVGLNTLDESLQRIKSRVKKGGHDIPESDVRRRFQSRFSDLLSVLPFCDEGTFFDNENGFVEVARYKNGRILRTDTGRAGPKWLTELLEMANWKKNHLPTNG